MFWRKKSDGFDWHKHVRTTIKIKREARRQKVNGVVDAAVDGVKGAGKAGASVSASGLDAISRLISAPILWLSRGLGALLGGISMGLAKLFTPTAGLSERPGMAPMMGLAGVVISLLGWARARVDGWDAVAIILAIAGVLVLALLLGPPLFAGRGPKVLRNAAEAMQGLVRRLPGTGGISIGAQRGIAASLILALAGAAGWIGAQALGRLPSSTLAGIPGLSRPALEGVASAVTGDTLRISGQVVRLAGIEAPELEQSCGGEGSRERRWKCGDAARSALRDAVRAKSVSCHLSGSDARGTRLGTCNVGATDIAGDLVTRGHVFAQQGLFSTYGRIEQDARNARRGIWKGTSERPEEFRNRHWEIAKKTAPDGCAIKGRVNRNEKTYVMPWSNDYRGTTVRKDKGERWFCTEAEAQAAGWRPAGQRGESRGALERVAGNR